MEDSADFVQAGGSGSILGGVGLGAGAGGRIIGKSSNLKVDAKKLYERRVGREKLSKQRSNFPLLGPAGTGGEVDSDTESKDPGDRDRDRLPHHSDYEDHHHEDKATAAYDFHDQQQHHHPRLDRLPPAALSSGPVGSSRSKAIAASGLNRRVAAVVDQVMMMMTTMSLLTFFLLFFLTMHLPFPFFSFLDVVDNYVDHHHQTLAEDGLFQSEASASELSDTGGDEEKHGYKPRRRSVMAGKVISRRRFPSIGNSQSTAADEKETDMDGGGSAHGQGPAPTGPPLPLQQPLRVPRQLPAKSTGTRRWPIS